MAQSGATGRTDAGGADRAARRRVDAYRRRATLLAVGMAGLMLAVELVLVLVFRAQGRPPRSPTLLVVLLVVLPVVPGVTLWAVPRLTLRRPEVRSAIEVADRRDLTRVRRLLQRGKVVGDGDRPTAQAIVDLNGRQSVRRQLWLVAASLVLFAVAALVTRRWTTWIYVAVFAVVGPTALVSQRRMLTHAAAQGLVPRPRGEDGAGAASTPR